MYEDKIWSFTTKGEEPPSPDDKNPAIPKESKKPSEGQVDVELNPAEISFTFDKDMDKGTITSTTIQFLEKGIVLAQTPDIKFDEAGKRKVTIDPKKSLSPKTQYTIKVGPGVKDTTGKPLESEQSWKLTTKGEEPPSPDDKNPAIPKESKKPSEGQVDVELNPAEISFTFDKDMDKGTITSTTIQFLEKGIVLAQTPDIKFDEAGKRKVTIDPKKSLSPKTQYTIKVGPGVKDTTGKPLESEQSWSFTTKGEEPPSPDDKNPAIPKESKKPSEGQVDVELNPAEISFTFDKDMDKGTINIANIQAFENTKLLTALEYDINVDSTDKKKIILSLKRQLNPKTQYTIKVGPGVKDTTGKPLESEQSWSFTTK